MVVAAGCGTGSPNDPAQHSVLGVLRCLHHHGVRAHTEPVSPSPEGAIPLFDVQGLIAAHVGPGTVKVTVIRDSVNIAEYAPNGTATPRALVEAVWACAGHETTTTPYTCSNDVCTTSY